MTDKSTEGGSSLPETAVIANKQIGSSFDSFLEEEGIKQQVHEQADARLATFESKLGIGLEATIVSDWLPDTTITYKRPDAKVIMKLVEELRTTAECVGERRDMYGQLADSLGRSQNNRCDEIVKEIEKLITGN